MNIRVLDLGCGKRKRKGAVGADYNPKVRPDVLCNLNVFPYPFVDQAFDEVYLDNVLEHLDNVIRVMEELYRICRPGALIKVIVPYFRSMWAATDPTHNHFFGVDSFAYFDPLDELHARMSYSAARFLIERRVFNEGLRNGPLRKLVLALANRWPSRYEYYLSHLFPLDSLSFYLRRA